MTTADLARWKQLVAPSNLWIWDYVTDFSGYMHPFPNYHVLGPNVRDFASAGATHYYAEGENDSDGGELAELKAFVISKMAWDPTLNDTQLIETFLDGYYGAAANHLREYMRALTDAVAPTSAERHFSKGDCVHVAERPWAAGGQGVVTGVHSDGTYDVNVTVAEDGFPSHPRAVSWAYMEPCSNGGGGQSQSSAQQPSSSIIMPAGPAGAAARARGERRMVVDMVAESCDLPQNGSHSGWACGYLTPRTAMRALRAQLAATATPGLTAPQAARVARSALPSQYVALVKWEELRSWVTQHPDLEGPWPLPEKKEVAYQRFVGALKAFGISKVAGEGAPWTEEWLRDRIFFGNASSARTWARTPSLARSPGTTAQGTRSRPSPSHPEIA